MASAAKAGGIALAENTGDSMRSTVLVSAILISFSSALMREQAINESFRITKKKETSCLLGCSVTENAIMGVLPNFIVTSFNWAVKNRTMMDFRSVYQDRSLVHQGDFDRPRFVLTGKTEARTIRSSLNLFGAEREDTNKKRSLIERILITIRQAKKIDPKVIFNGVPFVATIHPYFHSNGNLMLLTSSTSSCHNGDEIPKINLTTKDREIIGKAYSKTYMFPDNFNYEKNLDGSLYYENTISIRTSKNTWVELDTNEKRQAKEWSEISSLAGAYYRELVAERETEKYFEFKRVYSVNQSDIILSRVHKSSYFVPSLDKLNPSNNIGTLKVTPIDKESTKLFIEYLWTSYLVCHPDKVLEYRVIEYPDNVRYNLKSVNVIYGDWGVCDVIEVKEFDFYIDKQSGKVTFESSKIKELKGTCR